MATVLRFLVWSKVVIAPKQAPLVVCDDQAASLSHAAALPPFIAKTIPWTKGLRRIETDGRTRSEEVGGPAVSSHPDL